MIFDVDGKRIAFGMQWKSRLSEGNVHRDARAAKSRYFWHAEKAFYFGVLGESDAKVKLKAPLYSGAIALLHRFPDVPNLMIVLALAEGGFLVCGIHQGRPRQGCDAVVQTQLDVSAMLGEFKILCGTQSFKLYGDVHIGGIERATMADVLIGAEQAALLRKTQSAIVNPIAFLAVGAVVVGAGLYGYQSYSAYKKAEAQRLELASKKNSQQLYLEELAIRRRGAAILARNVESTLAPLRAMTMSVGGWRLAKATCNLPAEKQMVCTFDYSRRPGSKGTFETFVAVAKEFDHVEFVGENIQATKIYKTLPFVEMGKAIDAAKTQREEVIEFGSSLQRIGHLGKPKREEFQPFGLPATANLGELTSGPVMSAKWEFVGPFRNAKLLFSFPEYAVINQLGVTYTDMPAYEANQSLAMVTVSGQIFSKSN
jgi:hypothetical protein